MISARAVPTKIRCQNDIFSHRRENWRLVLCTIQSRQVAVSGDNGKEPRLPRARWPHGGRIPKNGSESASSGEGARDKACTVDW
jgi:hypothetical protein